MRTLMIALVFVVVTTGCGDGSTGPVAVDHAGTYELETINGDTLPYVLAQLGEDIYEITSGELTLDVDGTFSHGSTFEYTQGGITTTETGTFGGTYSRNNNTIAFVDSDGETYTGSLDGDALTMNITGFVGVYRK